MAEIKCIDVSEWQGDVDFEKVKAQGVSCVVLRAGFGRNSAQKDSMFEKNYTEAKKAGLNVGAYWYSYADSVEDANREAKACISVLGNKEFELPVFYDMEDNSQSDLGKETLTKMAKTFMALLLTEGYRVGVYANANWFENYLDYKTLYGTYYIWLAQYNDVPEFECDMWQYTSSAKIDGISGNVDMNIIYNPKLVKAVQKPEEKPEENFETALLQSILMISQRLGVISQSISPIDNKKGRMTNAAILQMKKALSLEENEEIDLVFVRRMYQQILDSLPVVGDVNGDGAVNIKDATALQKEIAGVFDV
ncbi:MAG: hypothetical protein IJZ54_08410 [Clostridia bacterium]|nr:hypothetical protein [Clostridia bacterium]